jgi:hypothetical protein
MCWSLPSIKQGHGLPCFHTTAGPVCPALLLLHVCWMVVACVVAVKVCCSSCVITHAAGNCIMVLTAMQLCCRLSGGSCRSYVALVPGGQVMLLLWRVGVPADWPAVLLLLLGAVPAAVAGLDLLRTLEAIWPGRSSRGPAVKTGQQAFAAEGSTQRHLWLPESRFVLLPDTPACHDCI